MYLTEAEFKERYSTAHYKNTIQGDRTTADATTRFNLISSEVSEIIDSSLNMRYEVPLDPIPTVIKGYAAVLINYRAVQYNDGGLTEVETVSYENAIKAIRDYRATTRELTDSDGIIDEYQSKRVYSTGGSVSTADDVSKINKYFAT